MTIRLFDMIVSACALIVLTPLLLLIIAAINIEDSGPIFFIQTRVGIGGRPFNIFKFRTMIDGAEKTGAGLFIDGEDDFRITKTGRFLRKTSLDELPQLINIFIGDMSLVGPRPGMPMHVEEYSRRQMKRLSVLPGLTGWAQINGRNSLTWPQRIELDLSYIENRSFFLNIVIIARTIPSLIRSGGLYGARENFDFTGKEETGGRDGEKIP
ncbi:MAG: sugar transferase [Candidatus Krumholzibacteriota bacterium]|nr:sugar transferase [Candidatus Krumholzibacteriota bacterium]